MFRSLWLIVLFSTLHYAGEISPAKYATLVKRGEKVASTLCDETKLLKIKSKTYALIVREIDTIKPCTPLNTRNKEALAYFLLAGERHDHSTSYEHIHVPQSAKCPVCGMFVAKYPKWVAVLGIGEERYYFDGVKDMMKFYIFDSTFPYDRTKITTLKVTDFYTLHAIDAKKAFYVIGSDMFGPMGNELIPFDTKSAAENFMQDHRGEKLIRFKQISAQLIMGLDGVAYHKDE